MAEFWYGESNLRRQKQPGVVKEEREMEREEERDGVKRLLEEAGKVLMDIDKKVSEGAGFNVFRLCGVDHYETIHSKILAEFLNPQGSHGQRTLFLKCFQKLLKDHFKFKGEFSDRTSVTTEVSFDEAQAGDIIYYGGHVGIYIGNNQIVHASTVATGIKISSAFYRSIITVRRYY